MKRRTQNKNEVTLSYKITGIERSLRVVKRKRNKKRLKQLMFYPSQITATIKINPYLNDLHLKMTKVLSIWIALPIF